ncbi:MAG: hypothetical protein WBE72_18095 [Terracidiphilus sp.]
MFGSVLILCVTLAVATAVVPAQVVVRVEPAQLEGPRTLAEQTRTAAIRDYLESWQSLKAAFAHNQAELLDEDFAGIAREKLAGTIHEQAALGIRTPYQDLAHDLRIVYYSPEGLSIELTDTVSYDVQVLDHERPIATQQVHARYIAILTPSEVRWRVRVFEAVPE